MKQGTQGELSSYLAAYRPGWSLPRAFYSDETVYRADLEQIWRKGWLFAGHACELAKPGDWLTLQVDTDSVLVIRGEDGTVRGLHNVCRHRGSQIVPPGRGSAKRLVCPYHQWTYDTAGALTFCRGMHDLDKSQFGLKRVHCEMLEGLIFICLAKTPPPFGAARELMSPFLLPQGFERAKVAKQVDYEIHANWKLVWENNRECFHCNVNHPQYIKANWDHYNADDSTPQIRAAMNRAIQKSESKWANAGLAVSHRQPGMTEFPDAERGIWYSANRTALVEGWVSESMDGKQVSTLMGLYTDPDVGTLRARTLPNFWNHSSCDHGVSTLLLPAGPHKTLARVSWLVHEDAVEGRDYRLDKLMPFWQLTAEQDWEICERQQRGIESSAYEPGPYSTYKEYNVDAFVRWYVKTLAAGASA
ncbi:MAG TPA: aromatic ring-hydroxylating dioxygenase subunit alpha [Burkholderiales bacterium]|nr:aromatic ring-hydroxylating dioxygenase subunit alpha [Burkholderiales bacterium]